MQKEYFVDALLPLSVSNLFTYRITEAEAKFVAPGMRVAVPFGKTKLYTALICKVHQTPPEAYQTKDIHQILDTLPIVTKLQLEHWNWISKYYMCTLGEVFRTAMPAALLLESETLILKNDAFKNEETELSDDEFLIVEALQHRSSLKLKEVSDILSKKRIIPLIKGLIEKKAVRIQEELREQYKPKLVKYVRLNQCWEADSKLNELMELLQRATKQRQMVLTYFSLQAASKKPVKAVTLQKKSNTTAAILSSLVAKGIFDIYYLQTDRVEYPQKTISETKTLNEFQKEALTRIKNAFKSHNVCLLHGVTSSGKTEIYTKLIEETIEKGEQVLYLLPEIALTTQLIQRLQNCFGAKVVVYHSRYSINERVEIWNKILHGSTDAQIVLGARSAVFLPLKKPGLIIIDEEHEASFKQFDPTPRYHARDTAIVLGKLHNAKTILGSATPSLESFYNAKNNKYGYVPLKRRFGNILMPEIELIDIREKYRKKRMKGHFSDRMIEVMEQTLSEGKQVILFQNRRGYAPVVECHTCGNAPQCPNCDVSLTYHKITHKLCCHYCAYQMAMPYNCPACGSEHLSTKGFGTEQIESELNTLFPDNSIARMDMDTTRGKYGFQKIINAFQQRETDILVGTQMLSKGLDFDNVSLVGILNADNMLNFPEFRAHERSFQLMVQVSGRAGRYKKRGKVLIQTFNPYHNILQQVSTIDYSSMYTEQLQERRQYHYPPLYRLIKITLKHKDLHKVNTGSEWLGKALRNFFGDSVLGPVFPPVARIRNEYLKHITVKINRNQSLEKTKKTILRCKNNFLSIQEFRAVKFVINVDP